MADKPYILQQAPFRVPTTDGKVIAEHFGLAATGDGQLSIAHMIAPPAWGEPYQCPEFDEYTFIIRGRKQFEVAGDTIVLGAGQSIKITRGTRIRYSNPFPEECEYLSICVPAFSLDTVHREE
ncbi:MAG: cupin domain-containing protein [Bacteroidetes bacterium]|nr:MAG: cupin domain-containing protein [Bacteroidota bacterium]